MCGIVGAVQVGGPPPDPAILRRMAAALHHRGPDDEGYHTAPGVGLGVRRLSIIDVAGGHQPLANEDGTIWVVGNGEIYNHRALRAALTARGHRFRTGSDIEVVVHAYEEHGEAFVEHLWGMFALAIWDSRRQRLLLARDRVGEKPLLYAPVPGGLVFASEFAALLAHPAVPRTVEPRAIYHYLHFGYVPAPLSAFAGVYKLPPARLLVWEAGAQRQQRYWQVAYAPKVSWPEEEAAERLRALLRDAVRLRLMSEVPLGALLSGGVDSSTVVALMAEATSVPVPTFSIGFSHRDYDELAYARLVAQRFGTSHHELVVEPSATAVLPALVRHYGEPFADSSAVPTWYVAQLTRQHVTVALTGDGGDEAFAGYDRYQAALVAARLDRLPAPARRLAGRGGHLLPQWGGRWSPWRRAQRWLTALPLAPAERYLRWVGLCAEEVRAALLAPAFAHQVAAERPAALLAEAWGLTAGGQPLDALLAADRELYLPNDLLVKVDIATMAHSLEARAPFLDHRVLEFAARLPARLQRRGASGKYLLKRAMADLLPEEILRRRKMGFGVPLAAWLRGPLARRLRETLLAPQSLRRGYFRPAVVRRLVDEHVAGRADHAALLWALLVLEEWHAAFIEGPLASPAPPARDPYTLSTRNP